MSLKLLIVDDEPDAADAAARLLAHGGFQTQVAYNGSRALEAARSFDPDVFVLDIGMPILNGFQLAGQLRAMPEFAHKFFIAVTAYSDQQHLDQASQVKFDEYLVKPFKPGTLFKILADVALQH